jgi:L-alanine-DL-glutamate epimerase-like enolase superfamily enzyme
LDIKARALNSEAIQQWTSRSGEKRQASLFINSSAEYSTRDCCAQHLLRGQQYMAVARAGATKSWGLSDTPVRRYEDLDAFLHSAGELAQSLLEHGVRGMNTCLLDLLAESSDGKLALPTLWREALEPFRKIRAAVDSQIDILVELRWLWDLPGARQVISSDEEFKLCWIEDLCRATNAQELASLFRQTKVPIATGDTRAGLASYEHLIDQGFQGVVILAAGMMPFHAKATASL